MGICQDKEPALDHPIAFSGRFFKSLRTIISRLVQGGMVKRFHIFKLRHNGDDFCVNNQNV